MLQCTGALCAARVLFGLRLEAEGGSIRGAGESEGKGGLTLMQWRRGKRARAMGGRAGA